MEKGVPRTGLLQIALWPPLLSASLRGLYPSLSREGESEGEGEPKGGGPFFFPSSTPARSLSLHPYTQTVHDVSTLQELPAAMLGIKVPLDPAPSLNPVFTPQPHDSSSSLLRK